MARLSFITDATLEMAVSTVLKKAETAKIRFAHKIDTNVIDPFSMLFELAGFNCDEKTWLELESQRKAQKTLSNAIGAFHETLLGSIAGWEVLNNGGLDLVSTEHRIVAEIKNKHNTVKGSDRVRIYDLLEKKVMDKGQQYEGYTAYFVEIIPKSAQRYEKPFTPSDNSKGQKRRDNPLIRQIDGYSFYGKVTGVPDALAQIFHILPEIIQQQSTTAYTFANLEGVNAFFKKAFHGMASSC